MKKIHLFQTTGIIALILLTGINTALAASFSDVPSSHANFDAIEYVKANNIVTGYADGTFKPDSTINRAEFTKIVVGAVIPETQDCAMTTPDFKFSDVDKTAWYADYVCMALSEGIIAGYSDGTFKPAQEINFAEAAKIIANAFALKSDYSPGPNDNITPPPWYFEFVDALAAKNAIPTTINYFDRKITRGEMVEMIYRLKNPTIVKPTATYDTLNNQASFIRITSPENDALLYEEPFYIQGETSPTCDTMTVTATNTEYNINDVYTLTDYHRGSTTFKYGVQHSWKNLDVGNNSYSFSAKCDDGNKTQSINIFFSAGGGVEMGKPVIYLYPQKEQKVFVSPKPEGGITISEPALGNGWNVTAFPDGTIVDRSGVTWPYLFWEGYSNIKADSEGFLVRKNDLGRFFDENLSYLGLNSKEITDFKEYWLAKLNEDKYYYISFVPQEELDRHAPILVEPKPDTVIRVFFDYRVSDAPFAYTQQVLNKGPERSGFTMIEWGGRLY